VILQRPSRRRPAVCSASCTLRANSGVLPECFLRGQLNGRIVNTVRGLALGSDGVQRLEDVAVVSHTLRRIESPLAEAVAERMKTNAASHAS
jgi:hypothetical protein